MLILLKASKMKVLVCVILMLFGTILYGQERNIKPTSINLSFSEVWFKYSGFDSFETMPWPELNLKYYPFNWLSVGGFYCWNTDEGDKSIIKYRNYGGNFGVHAYPIFNWLKIDYLKKSLDIYALGVLQHNYSNYLSKEVPDHVTLIQNHNRIGYAFGLSYYPGKHVGMNLEYKWTGRSFSYTEYLKAGIIFRL